MVRKLQERLDVGDFVVEQIQIPEPRQGEVLTEAQWISLDPYLAGRMRSWSGPEPDWLQGIVVGRMVGRVVTSQHPTFSPGDWVAGPGRWQSHDLNPGDSLHKLTLEPGISPSMFLGVLGSSGLTAWVGIKRILRPKKGETLTISSAAGIVGGIAGQLAKGAGAQVVGIAGGPQKCSRVVDDLGFDDCLDYRHSAFRECLAKAVNGSVDAHFENVGAPTLDPVLGLMRDHGRIALCGLIAHYLDDNPVTLTNFRKLLSSGLSLQGFRALDYLQDSDRAASELREGIKAGTITVRETITRGLENAPQAYLSMLEGGGEGKHLIRLE